MAESKVRDENYFQVSGWMLNRLNLKGIPLQVFSIIYGFSQDGETYFTGSLQYLMDFTNASKPTIIKSLKELVEKGFVLKYENEMNGVKFNKYRANLPLVKEFNQGSQISLPGGSKETLPNNISINNKTNIDIDIVNEITELYHSICVSFPTLRAVSESRRKAILARLNTYTIDDFRTVFQNAESSSFLKGADGGWKATFDWMVKEANFIKVLEGNYADKPKKYGRKEPVPGWVKRSLDDDEIESIKRTLAEPVPEVKADELPPEMSPEAKARLEALRKRLGITDED